MTPQQLAKAGETLYGSGWRVALARALGVSERTVRRWATDRSAIPDGLAGDLAGLCREQAKLLTKLAEQL